MTNVENTTLPSRVENLIGHKYGRLTVISFAGYNKHQRTLWQCRCECGAITVVQGSCMRSGHTKSCGCLEKETKKKNNLKHGLRRHPLYGRWLNVKDRCLNPHNSHYKDYGGRGIEICQEWKDDFKSFYDWAVSNGYEKGLSIERIDVNKGYNPENCTWITLAEQAKNKRNSLWIDDNGVKKKVHDIAKENGLAPSTIYNRIQRGKNPLMNRQERKRPVIQFSLDGIQIAEYESASEAMRETGCDQGSITRCCQGRNHTSKGFIWRYKDAI